MTRKKSWTETEKGYLREHYPSISANQLTDLIRERSALAIRKQARQMGLQKCHERLREMGKENAKVRWDRAMGQPEPPPQ